MSGSQTSRSSSVDLPTLLVTAIASATAAYVASKLWTPGTLAAAAFTPVLIALIKEALYKPAEVVTRAVPVRGVVRSTSSAGQPERPAETPTQAMEQRVPQPGEAPGASRRRRPHKWKVAIVTGLLGFVLAAVIITVPELLAGGSAAGGGRETTFFGGGSGSSDDPEDTTTTTIPEESETNGVPPASTVTVPPAETITVPPAQTTPVPAPSTPPPEEQPPEAPATPPPPPG